MLKTVSVEPYETFDIDVIDDNLEIRGHSVFSAQGIPPKIYEGETINWEAGGNGNRAGWKMCFTPDEGNKEIFRLNGRT